MNGEPTNLRVAAVQMESVNGDIKTNLERAGGFVERAAEEGAKLIVLPEFMPTGYIYSVEIWEAGEPREGPTVRWLRDNSRRLGVWLGTSFLEAEGEDFYNTFVLCNPHGEEDGRVRKQTPALAEAYFSRGYASPHVIESEFGKVGVGICYENQLAYIPQLMYEQSVDIMLQPHSAPSPMPNPLFPKKYIEIYNRNLREISKYYADLLGIPVVMVNKSGTWDSPIPMLPFLTQHSSFPGYSAIVDSDGTVKVQLGGEEGVIVEEIALDPSRKAGVKPTSYGRWALKEPWVINTFRVVEALGTAWYRCSRERRRRGREISGETG
ncbi:MAG: carbon-nitrogen hydrolase family protein [Actinomycetota bacterium]